MTTRTKKTMAATPTLASVWCVFVDGAKVHEGTDYKAAIAARRASGAERAVIRRVDMDVSP